MTTKELCAQIDAHLKAASEACGKDTDDAMSIELTCAHLHAAKTLTDVWRDLFHAQRELMQRVAAERNVTGDAMSPGEVSMGVAGMGQMAYPPVPPVKRIPKAYQGPR